MYLAQAGFKKGKGGLSPADLLVNLGPTLKVDIGLKSRSAPGEVPNLALTGERALIDTGAGGDCIDEALAKSLGLPEVDEGEISGVGGTHRAYVYMARLYIPSMDLLLFQRFTGVKLSEGRQWHRVLLGRSFLRNYKLIYDGATGEVSVSQID